MENDNEQFRNKIKTFSGKFKYEGDYLFIMEIKDFKENLKSVTGNITE